MVPFRLFSVPTIPQSQRAHMTIPLKSNSLPFGLEFAAQQLEGHLLAVRTRVDFLDNSPTCLE